MQMPGRTKLIQALALLVIGMSMLLEPQVASAGGDECSPTCGWETCDSQEVCDLAIGCGTDAERCLDCEFFVTCGDECQEHEDEVKIECWVVPPDGGGGGAN